MTTGAGLSIRATKIQKIGAKKWRANTTTHGPESKMFHILNQLSYCLLIRAKNRSKSKTTPSQTPQLMHQDSCLHVLVFRLMSFLSGSTVRGAVRLIRKCSQGPALTTHSCWRQGERGRTAEASSYCRLLFCHGERGTTTMVTTRRQHRSLPYVGSAAG